MKLFGVFVLVFCLIGVGIRSAGRIARRARAAGLLDPGATDGLSNTGILYSYAFSPDGRGPDSWLMLLGFGGAAAIMILGLWLFG